MHTSKIIIFTCYTLKCLVSRAFVVLFVSLVRLRTPIHSMINCNQTIPKVPVDLRANACECVHMWKIASQRRTIQRMYFHSWNCFWMEIYIKWEKEKEKKNGKRENKHNIFIINLNVHTNHMYAHIAQRVICIMRLTQSSDESPNFMQKSFSATDAASMIATINIAYIKSCSHSEWWNGQG